MVSEILLYELSSVLDSSFFRLFYLKMLKTLTIFREFPTVVPLSDLAVCGMVAGGSVGLPNPKMVPPSLIILFVYNVTLTDDKTEDKI